MDALLAAIYRGQLLHVDFIFFPASNAKWESSMMKVITMIINVNGAVYLASRSFPDGGVGRYLAWLLSDNRKR